MWHSASVYLLLTDASHCKKDGVSRKQEVYEEASMGRMPVASRGRKQESQREKCSCGAGMASPTGSENGVQSCPELG